MDEIRERFAATATKAEVADLRAILKDLAPKIHEMHGFIQATLPHLATKADVSAVKAELADTDRRLSEQIGKEVGALSDRIGAESKELSDKIASRPTTGGLLAVAGLVAAIVATPFFGPWLNGWRVFLGMPPLP